MNAPHNPMSSMLNSPAELELVGRPPPDLNDPKQLVSELDMAIGGLEQQSNATKTVTALAGHPFPAQFYDRVAQICAAAKAFVLTHSGAKETNAPPTPTDKPKRERA